MLCGFLTGDWDSTEHGGFGGWTKPHTKQYLGTHSSCGAGVDYNWRPDAAPSSAASDAAAVDAADPASCAADWGACRAAFAKGVFGPNGTPTAARAPDYVLDRADTYAMHGLPSPGAGSGVGDVAWANNLTGLVWTMQSRVVKNLTLNTTIWYSLSTTLRAAANYPPPPYASAAAVAAGRAAPRADGTAAYQSRAPGAGGKEDALPPGPGQPRDDNTPFGPHPVAPQGRTDTLLLYHNGHETATCTPNYDGVVDYFNRLGFDVMELMMPLIGCNQAYQYGNPRSHYWFQQFEDKGDPTLRYFVEPVALAVNYARQVLGYGRVVLVGLSGGGWTTTLAAALLPGIDVSFPVAGSVPKWTSPWMPHDWVPDLPEGRQRGKCQPGNPFVPPPLMGAGGDYEQEQARPAYAAAGGLGYQELYVLAALEPHRAQLQILHEYDSCCFRAAGLHKNITKYNAKVQGALRAAGGGWMQTAATAGNYHEVNLRDKVLIATLVEKLRAKGPLDAADFMGLPFDDLEQAPLPPVAAA